MSKNPFEKFEKAKARNLSITSTMTAPEKNEDIKPEIKSETVQPEKPQKSPEKGRGNKGVNAQTETEKPTEVKTEPLADSISGSITEELLKAVKSVPKKKKEPESRVNFYIRKTLKNIINSISERQDTSINTLVHEKLESSIDNKILDGMELSEIMRYYQEAKIDKETFQTPEKEPLQLLLPQKLIKNIDAEREKLKKRLKISISKGIFIEILLLSQFMAQKD